MKASSAIALTGLALILATLAGCAAIGPVPVGPRRLDEPFWQRSGHRIRVLTTEVPKPEIYRDGGDDFYHDLVSDTRDADMIDFLNHYHRTDTQTGAERLIATLFEERGFLVTINPIRFSIEKKHPIRSGFVWSGPLLRAEQIRNEMPGETLALVVSTTWWGVRRKYGGIFPTGPHRAHVELHGELYDLANNLLLWAGAATGTSDIDRQWNEPPAQPKLRSALDNARAQAARDLTAALRFWDGTFAFTAYSTPKRRTESKKR